MKKTILWWVVLTVIALGIGGCNQRIENWEVSFAQNLCIDNAGLDYFYIGSNNSTMFKDKSTIMCNNGVYFQRPYPISTQQTGE